MKYHLVVLGCQMNLSDAERVKAVIEQMGFTYTDNENDAQLLGIIACSVRQKPIDKVYSRIYKWNKQKDTNNVITFLSGCVLPDDRVKFLKLFDFVFEMSELNDLPNMLKTYGIVTPHSVNSNIDIDNNIVLSNTIKKTYKPNIQLLKVNNKNIFPQNTHISDLWNVKPSYTSNFEAYVPIQNGCNKFCSYCAVPYTRGREVSRPSAKIIDEVVKLMQNGYKSITLLGQNVNSYGLDNTNEINFAQLLDKIGQKANELGNPAWVYFTSPHPHDMTRDVIESIATHKVLAKQIHLPIQSGDNDVLQRMNRKYDVDKYRQSISYIKELIPQATIFTDIIVGFTGETEDQFLNTVKIFDEFKYNMAYIAMYSPRPGAKSYEWPDDIAKDIKKERLQRLSDKLESVSLVYNNSLIGKQMTVLVRGIERKTGFLTGHNEGKIVTRILSYDSSLIGKFINVKITEVASLSITGEII